MGSVFSLFSLPQFLLFGILVLLKARDGESPFQIVMQTLASPCPQLSVGRNHRPTILGCAADSGWSPHNTAEVADNLHVR